MNYQSLMQVSSLIVCCVFLASVAAFTLPDEFPGFSRSDSSLEVAESPGCECKNGRCVTDNRGKSKCNCPPGFALQDESTCERCDCGKKGRCMFIPLPKSAGGFLYEKKCLCDDGSAEKDGVCIDCHCGEHSKCEFEGDEKICYCIDGYSEKEGVCTKCDCGFFGECKFEFGHKICMCDENYLVDDGSCKADSCFETCGIPHNTETADLLCEGGPFGDVTCKCTDGSKAFDEKGKSCEVDRCMEKCGVPFHTKDGGLVCEGGPFGDVKCRCTDDLEAFDDTVKLCRVDYCRLKCGETAGVDCVGDMFEENIMCICKDETEAFDASDKQCKVDYCRRKCGTGDGVICEGDIFQDTVTCSCTNPTKSYDELIKDCKECDCGENSWACDFEHGEKICTCKSDDIKRAQYEGRCVDCNCGDQSDGCRFVDDEKVCQCFAGYIQKGETCKVKCSMFRQCQNGGHCYKGICNCLPGTSGEFCEVIDECDHLCPKQPGINCTFDAENVRAFCKCKDEQMGFQPETEECRPTCDDYSVCKHDGECKELGYSRFCRCLEGTEGDFCEKIPECDEKDCGYEAICEYDINRRSAVCKCNEEGLTFDSEDRRCKNTCHDPSDCMNGGICEPDEFSKFCRCLDGTKGHFCEEVPGCAAKDCGSNAKCMYDIKRRIAACVCDDESYAFDPVSYKCKKICDADSDCMNGGKCEETDYGKFCHCLEGTEGDVCEDVTKCKDLNCASDAECVYDVKKQMAVCKCKDEDYGFDPMDFKCKKICHADSDCMNGGMCEENDEAKLCHCLEGTEGDVCEDVPGCKDLNCGSDAKCVYDVKRHMAVCICNDENYGFHPMDFNCKKICHADSDCMNGGMCEENDYAKFCRCLEGTEGDVCENVPGCNDLNCASDAECVYDVKRQMAVCKCKDEDYGFDPIDFKCKRKCSSTSDCKNGGDCVENLCRCLEGTEGDFCEKVGDCDIMECGYDSKCMYDVEKKRAVCKCEETGLSFDPKDTKCKRNCTIRNCIYGGSCPPRGDTHFCDCLPGTSGDYCETVDDCEKHPDMCKGESWCTFDLVKKEAYCQCNDYSKKYDPQEKECKDTCYDDSMCFNGGLCMHSGDHLFCRCQIGTSGELCQVVDDCERGVCGDLKETTCTYDSEAETVKCGCKNDNSLYDESTKTCKNDEKICVCPEGFAFEDGQCKKKGCVEKKCFDGKCEIIDGQEVCSCFEGYALEGDHCKKLNCSKTACLNGTCVVRRGNVEECVCSAGFTLDRDICIRGVCRQDTCYGGTCQSIDGELMCVCPDKFHLEGIGCYETQCRINHCFGGKCVVEDDKEICTCKEGYILVNDVCKRILCEKKNCFGGQCHIVDGVEECTCLDGYSIFDDVCRKDLNRQ